MAPEQNKWLSFSLSPMEMLTTSSTSSQSQILDSTVKLAPFDVSSSSLDTTHHYYFFDNFYANGWGNPRAQVMYSTEGDENKVTEESVNGAFLTSFMESQIQQPKLEDFLGGDSAASLIRYSDSQTETQDSSSLTHIYDHGGPAYFNDDHHQEEEEEEEEDFKALAATAGFQALSTNSGSEVDDSASNQLEFLGQSTESGNELGYSYSQSQCPTGSSLSLGVNTSSSSSTTNTQSKAIVSVELESCKKSVDTFGQRTSIYRGVTRHRWTGRYEAHLWDNSCRREGQARKGRQVYLGGYDKEDKAARAYDLAALKYWGPTATTNFPVSNYTKELEEMTHVTKQEFIASLRRKSSGFSRGASIYRGVTRHHQQGRWQARIGRVAGNKDLYLGTFATEEEAAEAYDIAAIKFRGVNAVTNFEMSRYDVEAIAKSALPIGGAAKRLKLSLDGGVQRASFTNNQQSHSRSSAGSISFGAVQPISSAPYALPFDPAAAPLYVHHLFHNMQPANAGASDISGSVSSPPMPLLPSSSEFYIWPNQSY